MHHTSSQDVLTVRRLRLGVGVVGTALPVVLPVGFVLVTGDSRLLGSISGYYHTPMRDVFVGSMCAIGVFLISYRYRRFDDVLTSLAGVLAIMVALFPTSLDTVGALSRSDVLVGRVHGVAAAGLFALLAVISLFRFPMHGGGRVRNGVYRVCGAVILVAIVVALASVLLPESVRDAAKPVFWAEAVAVLAFGVAWLVKGESLFHRGAVP
ncbi:hypothetical protein GA0070616_5572 [Micromonospora nigra]|uniref:DUF998 domain-containing protein n=1 Tax=Micromonospora nigra TaxID=145857 RepID=A0A1C6T4K6_9ACTN|nr:hypothetical protein [Micromonospora nigra]SCL36756.1 hypothetical protein GA0070616_5572 [Micromonospora nigra]